MISSLAGAVILVCGVTAARAAMYADPAHLPAGKPYDYIVVGSGPGGGTVAARLSEDRTLNILVIEAGVSGTGVVDIEAPVLAPVLQPASPFDWNYTTTPQPGLNNRSVTISRGKVLGGTSALNFMVWTRGPRDDYDKYANLTEDKTWEWASISPLWQKLERLVPPADGHNATGEVNPAIHGHAGALNISVPGAPFPTDQPVVSAALELGGEFALTDDYNSGDPRGVGWVQGAFGGGVRNSAATAYLAPALASRSNLDVLMETQVTKLFQTGVHGENPIFRGVQFSQSKNATTYALNATREVIISAGTINTPQLLLLSGLGPASQLSALGIQPAVNLPDLGQHLIDQPLIALTYNAVPQYDVLSNLSRNSTFYDDTLDEWQTARQGIMTNSAMNHLGFFRIPENDTIFETQPDPSSGPTAPHIEMLVLPGLFPFIGLPPTGFFTAFGAAILSPTSRGSVSLASADPFVHPIIDPNYLNTTYDLLAARYAFRAVQRFASASAWANVLTGPAFGLETVQTDADIDAWARNNTGTIWHPVGTARMARCGSAAETGGVVNPDFTVKGVEGLRIVDASVLPSIPAAHPQAAIYIFAERAAELIKSGRRAC